MSHTSTIFLLFYIVGLVAGVGMLEPNDDQPSTKPKKTELTGRIETATPTSEFSSCSEGASCSSKKAEKQQQQLQQQQPQQQYKFNMQKEIADKQMEVFRKQEMLLDIQIKYFQMKTKILEQSLQQNNE